ncbi:fasciclin domain-containing protein [Flavobacterium sp. M31R6]|uniref:fasciclin domain-containing protein n=1 Tax=Flavobacterium sp. M31R6 TaxID=2739062 RepID=UPI001569C9CE|nr:fasciclin domain-containing protein [Flavobacterium sp. M31R6]QKJ62989.1 fasciclin domain-containing protein [Flavobacterium sp. M31R6]
MKNLLKLRPLGLLALVLVSFISCTKDDNEMESTPIAQTNTSIAEIAVSNPDYSIFSEALSKADLTSTLTAKGTYYTVFAPTNAAFTAFLKTTPYKSIFEVPRDVLIQILSNHIVKGKLKSTDLTTGYVKTLAKGGASSNNTLSMFVNTSNGVQLNGVSKVIKADILAANGVMHIVDAVIPLPTIVDHALANPNFSILVAALTYNPSSGFAGILSGTASSPFTVFAPTNDAFVAFLGETGFSGLSAIPANVLEKTLKYHVFTGANVLSSQLSDNQVIGMFSGQNVTVKFTPTRLVDVNSRNCNIIAVDVQCTNGVIHVLDKVLLPTF